MRLDKVNSAKPWSKRGTMYPIQLGCEIRIRIGTSKEKRKNEDYVVDVSLS